MKLRSILICLFLGCCLALQAQELKVLEFRADMSMIDAVRFPMNDFNGDRCGLIRLGMVLPEATFEGDIISTEYKDGEWWIYMPKNSNWITIKSKTHVPLRYEFEPIQSNVTYLMTVVEITGAGGKPLPTQQYLAFQISPTNAVLEVEGELWEVASDGSAMKFVNFGTYNYRVQAPNYHTEVGKVTVNDPEKTQKVIVTLEPDFVEVTLKVDADAEIWVNNEKKGTCTWTGNLGKGNYKIECKQAGHETSMITKEITADMNGQTIDLPKPTPLYGSLNIESTPNFATIYIDGEMVGETPKFVKEIMVGKHEIRITKEGYYDKTQYVTIDRDKRNQAVISLDEKWNSQYEISNSSVFAYDQIFTVNGASFIMKLIEGGTLQMGATSEQSSEADSDEKPVHSVTLNDYYLGETEVTQELWTAVMGNNPSHKKGDKLPVETVSWNDCQEFINKLNQLTGKNFRLPTEAEWEYAARGGKKSKGFIYSGSNNINSVAWYIVTTNDQGIRKVKSKQPNELNLFDMSGNVYEWCNDWYDSYYYANSSLNNPLGPSEGSSRVLRGGCWNIDAKGCRVSSRFLDYPEEKNNYYGFRLCLSE